VVAAIPISLLRSVVLVEAGVVVLGLSLFFGHGVHAGRAGRRNATRRALGAAALVAVLEETGGAARSEGDPNVDGGVDGSVDGRAPRPPLPRGVWLDVLTAVAPRLVGSERERLTAMAGDLGLLAAAESRCRSRLWWRRLQGVRLFTLLGGGATTVPSLLSDRRAEVRAQAAEWVVEHHDGRTIDALLAMLDADEDSTRFAVKDSLIRIGLPLTPRLAEHLRGRRGPTIAGALEVATALADPVLLPSALAAGHDEVAAIRAQSARLAGAIGGGPAVDMLTRLVGDESPEVRAAAAHALGQAGHWPAAAALYQLLGDSSWDVRQQSAVALRKFGSPGMLFLRRALNASDSFAADAARRTLDLPESVLGTF
jgi:HEAT repeat protein